MTRFLIVYDPCSFAVQTNQGNKAHECPITKVGRIIFPKSEAYFKNPKAKGTRRRNLTSPQSTKDNGIRDIGQRIALLHTGTRGVPPHMALSDGANGGRKFGKRSREV